MKTAKNRRNYIDWQVKDYYRKINKRMVNSVNNPGAKEAIWFFKLPYKVSIVSCTAKTGFNFGVL
jgi:hypothetical protein